jgi:reactive chlorine resistance protein C
VYGITGLQRASDLIGVVEICLGVFLAVHRWSPRLATIGGLGAAAEFVITLSFLFTTPSLSTAMSGFLLKDLMLLAAAVRSAGESLRVERAGGLG